MVFLVNFSRKLVEEPGIQRNSQWSNCGNPAAVAKT